MNWKTTTMFEHEGVIKFNLQHTEQIISDAIDLGNLNAWRSLFFNLRLIGRDPLRYDGLGYGNISQRYEDRMHSFIISATQTGHLAVLSKQNYCLIHNADIDNNRIISTGLSKPSSEALTHAMVYRLNPAIRSVIHVHSPEIWTLTDKIGLPSTAVEIPYGTPEMAQNVHRLYQVGKIGSSAVFSMLGHRDGLISYGSSLEEAAMHLISCYVKALEIKQKKGEQLA